MPFTLWMLCTSSCIPTFLSFSQSGNFKIYGSSSDVSWNTRVKLPTRQAKNTSVFFYPICPPRKQLRLWYSFRYEPRIAYYRPWCHLKTSLESSCSVIFILNPLTGQVNLNLSKNILSFQTINIYIMVFAKTHHFFLIFL